MDDIIRSNAEESLFTKSVSTTMNSFRSLASAVLAAWVLFCCYSSVVSARKDHNKPHPHRGILKAYTPGPFTDIKLSKKDEDKLASGQPVMKQTLPSKDDPNAGGGAICVQDVDAPKQVVWSQILDLNSYKGKVPKVVTCKNYMEAKTSEGKRMKTKMVVGVLPGYSVCSFVRLSA